MKTDPGRMGSVLYLSNDPKVVLALLGFERRSIPKISLATLNLMYKAQNV